MHLDILVLALAMVTLAISWIVAMCSMNKSAKKMEQHMKTWHNVMGRDRENREPPIRPMERSSRERIQELRKALYKDLVQ